MNIKVIVLCSHIVITVSSDYLQSNFLQKIKKHLDSFI